MEIEHRQISGN